jgi:2-hydroxymuconate-semialdehyde hydrolase
MEQKLKDAVEVQGQWIAYERSFPPPSVAFLHGIPTNRFLWRNVLKVLSAAEIGWIAFDLLGYGQSSKPDDVDLGVSSQARFIAAALQRIGWSGGTVVGHDVGGGVSQLLALDTAANVERLVLVDTIAYDSFPEPSIARLKDTIWDDILGAPDFDLKKGLKKGLRKGIVNSDRITHELVDMYEGPFSGVRGRLAYLRAARALKSADLMSRAQEIEKLTIPVLIVWGAQDTFQPLRYGQQLAEALVYSQLHVVEHAGHFLPEDSPNILGNVISKFATA